MNTNLNHFLNPRADALIDLFEAIIENVKDRENIDINEKFVMKYQTCSISVANYEAKLIAGKVKEFDRSKPSDLDDYIDKFINPIKDLVMNRAYYIEHYC